MNGGGTIQGLADAITNRSVRAVDALEQHLERIGAPAAMDLNCFRQVHAQEARAAARAIDERLDAGQQVGPLAGVPIGVKDNIATRLGSTACGSRFLENYQSPFTATAAQRLIDAGAVLIGRTNCDEFAMGSSTEHSAFGPTHNPWAHGYVPGGSSGGSAAAVAAGLCPGALGSDTGGSIRQPAAFCGIVGVKPSYGRVSRYGLVAFGSSLDQIGPMTRTVTDAALLLGVIAGPDPHDSTCAHEPVPDYVALLDGPPDQPLRVGVANQYRQGNHPAVNAALEEAIEVFRSTGARIVDIDLPRADDGIATYYVIAPAEASSNLARYDGVRFGRRATPEPNDGLLDLYEKSRAEGFGPEVQRRIMLGTYVLSAGYYDAYYRTALKARRLIRDDYDRAFQECDVLLGPTAPTTAFPLGDRQDPLAMYLGDIYTVNANIAGICGISLPAGLADIDGHRLPLGIQLQCPAFDEVTMLRAARLFEAQTDHGAAMPELCAP
jgi:aspartyl-tRNA(Asn)/glutamyl-tRNA(Gln) amidotransferase subunit A